MASLANQTISSSYDGLIKTSSDNAVGVSGVQLLQDGSGNDLALSLGRTGQGASITGNLTVDTNTLFVDAANNRVGVGTSSPEDMIHLVTSTGTAAVKFDGNGVGSARIHSTFGILNLEADDANENAASYISFLNHGSERMRIDSSGNVLVGTTNTNGTSGVSLFPTSGVIIPSGGIQLGGTGSANLLDDYEEGTFTPVVSDATSGGNTATGTFFGAYTKIGNIVHLDVTLGNIVTTGMTSGNGIYMQNLPFTKRNNGLTSRGSVLIDNVTHLGTLGVAVNANQTYCYFPQSISGTNDSIITVSAITASGASDIFFTLTYQV